MLSGASQSFVCTREEEVADEVTIRGEVVAVMPALPCCHTIAPSIPRPRSLTALCSASAVAWSLTR